MVYLVLGQWEQGFPEYECRFTMEPSQIPEKYRPKTPIWNGQELKDKSIVIWSDQGLGDVIQFIRYVNLLPPGASKIVIAVQKSLISLFKECLSLHSAQNNLEILEIVDRENHDFYTYDYQIPFLSLPGVFKTNLDNIPADIPYLIPPQNKREKCILPPKNGLKIGIVWGGEPNNTEYSKKACSPEFFIKLLDLDNVVLYSLQVCPDQPKIKPYLDHPRIVDLSLLINDFVDIVKPNNNETLIVTIISNNVIKRCSTGSIHSGSF